MAGLSPAGSRPCRPLPATLGFNKIMKILYIHESIVGTIPGVGSLAHNASTIEALKEIGHDVIVLDDKQRQNSVNIDKHRNIYRSMNRYIPQRLSIIPRDIYDIYRDRFSFKRQIERTVNNVIPDIIFERLTSAHCAGIKVSKEKEIPIIMEIHSPLEEKTQYFSIDAFPWYSRRVYKNALARADAIIVVSSVMKQYIINWGIDGKKIHVISNAAGSDMFKKIDPEKIRILKNRYDLHGKKVIGFIGSMGPYHGINDLIDAAVKVVEIDNNIIFMIVGPFRKEETKKIFLKQIKSYGLRNNIALTGGVDRNDIPAYIDCMDLCVIPNSNWYMSPIKLFEYGARGKTVVACKISPIEDIIEDGKDGILFDAENREILSEKLIGALRNAENTGQMGLRLQTKIKNKYTWLHNAERIQSIAKSLIE